MRAKISKDSLHLGVAEHHAQERLKRIEALGGFGAKRPQRQRDKTQYTRKQKYTKGPQGPFYFWGSEKFLNHGNHGVMENFGTTNGHE